MTHQYLLRLKVKAGDRWQTHHVLTEAENVQRAKRNALVLAGVDSQAYYFEKITRAEATVYGDVPEEADAGQP